MTYLGQLLRLEGQVESGRSISVDFDHHTTSNWPVWKTNRRVKLNGPIDLY